jgi:hypothetical protein
VCERKRFFRLTEIDGRSPSIISVQATRQSRETFSLM